MSMRADNKRGCSDWHWVPPTCNYGNVEVSHAPNIRRRALDQSGAESVRHKLPAAAKLPSTESLYRRMYIAQYTAYTPRSRVELRLFSSCEQTRRGSGRCEGVQNLQPSLPSSLSIHSRRRFKNRVRHQATLLPLDSGWSAGP